MDRVAKKWFAASSPPKPGIMTRKDILTEINATGGGPEDNFLIGKNHRVPAMPCGKEGETMKRMAKFGCIAAAVIIITWISAGRALAHCDTLDGPVVTKAREALEKKDVTLVLPWVAAEDEGEIRHAFELAVAVRGKGEKEKELADRFFFETLVRVHRAGEGAPFTGLEPAGLDLGPAIPAADKALETGDPKALLNLINQKVHDGIHKYYMTAIEKKVHAGESVEAGRDYVQAYVPYVHFVERLYDAASTPIAHGGGDIGEGKHGHPEPASVKAHAH